MSMKFKKWRDCIPKSIYSFHAV